jgi:uroporphyrinogen-III decarboxylase
VETAVLLAVDHPEAFAELLDIIHIADLGRTALALRHDVDMVVERGWYSSIDFWSPRIFKRHFKPRIAELAALAHQAGKLFGYVMTTGVAALGADLADAGVDLLYYADPAQDGLDLECAKRELSPHMALAGGINTSVTLTPADTGVIRSAVRDALECFGDTGGFILSPVDALFPDTPWSGVQAMIDAWREHTTM